MLLFRVGVYFTFIEQVLYQRIGSYKLALTVLLEDAFLYFYTKVEPYI